MTATAQQHVLQACPLPAGMVLFWSLVRLNQLCTQFGRFGSRYVPTCGWTDLDPVMGTTHDLVTNLELNPFTTRWFRLEFHVLHLFLHSALRPHVARTALDVEILDKLYTSNIYVACAGTPLLRMAAFYQYPPTCTCSWTSNSDSTSPRYSTSTC